MKYSIVQYINKNYEFWKLKYITFSNLMLILLLTIWKNTETETHYKTNRRGVNKSILEMEGRNAHVSLRNKQSLISDVIKLTVLRQCGSYFTD